MNGSVIVIIALIVVVVIAIIALSMTQKKSGKDRGEDTKRIQEEKVASVEKRQEPVKEDPEVTEAKKELYQYLNQMIRRMFQQYRKGNWNKLTKVGVPSERVQKYYDKIKESLPTQAVKLLDELFSCIEMEGSEERASGTIKDKTKLKQVFLDMVLPFYPVYYQRLDGIRYTALLNQTTLNLFHRLTGKKFRMGYKNRYSTGVTAYRWEGDRYQVYTADEKQLCDAIFRDGKIWEGYAVLPVDEDDKNWEVMQEGLYKEGKFVDGTLHYIYTKKIASDNKCNTVMDAKKSKNGSAEDITKKSSGKATDKAKDKSKEKSVEVLKEESTENITVKSDEEATEESADKSEKETMEKMVDKSSETKSTEMLEEQFVEKSAYKVTEQFTDLSIEKIIEEKTESSVEDMLENVVKQVTEE